MDLQHSIFSTADGHGGWMVAGREAEEGVLTNHVHRNPGRTLEPKEILVKYSKRERVTRKEGQLTSSSSSSYFHCLSGVGF